MTENTPEGIKKLADKSSLEELIRALAAEGNINHLSLSVGPDGKSFVAIFRDTIGLGPYRYMCGPDPIDVTKQALASVVIIQKEELKELRRRQREAASKIPDSVTRDYGKRKPLKRDKPKTRIDDEDFI